MIVEAKMDKKYIFDSPVRCESRISTRTNPLAIAMSLQELRETLFDYIKPRVANSLGAHELRLGDEYYRAIFEAKRGPVHADYLISLEGDFYVPVFNDVNPATLESMREADGGPMDMTIVELLGGRRGSECSTNAEGPCTWLQESFNVFDPMNNRIDTAKIAPAFAFDRKGEDPTFLGGWLSDDSPFGQHYNSIITERDDFKVEVAELEAAKQSLEIALDKAQSSNANVSVFPFVNWARANGSKAWYKDVDWSSIPFVHLSSDEKSSLDWSKINYKEAVNSESFDFNLVDWSDIKAASKGVAAKVYKSIDWAQFDFSTLDAAESALVDWTKVNFVQAQNSDTFDLTDLEWSAINGLDAKSKKKVYGKIDWGKVDYNDIASDANSAFDWAHVNIKKALSTSDFTLDAVDIDEAKNSKNFKKLSATLKKSSSDVLLAAASDATLQEIGYENFSSKLSDSLRKEFSTDSGEYALIMKPYSYARASAVAKAMGGQLASIDSDNSDDGFVDKLTGILEDKFVSRKLSQTTNDNSSLAWFSDHVGEDNVVFNALKLEYLSNINNVSADPTNEHWFVVEMPIDSGALDIAAV